MPLFSYIFATQKFINFEIMQAMSDNILSMQPLYKFQNVGSIEAELKKLLGGIE